MSGDPPTINDPSGGNKNEINRLPPVPPFPKKPTSAYFSASPRYTKGINEGSHLPKWSDYFDDTCDLKIPDTNDSFRIYLAGSKGPLILFLHGTGHTALSWSHVTRILKKEFCIAAYDCRGHGKTICSEFDLNSERLVQDGLEILKYVYFHFKDKQNAESIPIFIIGHSMGGVIATSISLHTQIFDFTGLVVIDVVEGTAIQSFQFIKDNISKFPKSFNNLYQAINWAINSQSLSNIESAKISIPSQLKLKDESWVWICPPEETKPFWESWFRGSSKRFLDSKAAKLLVCAGYDRLDTTLTRGHMQGKFQFVSIANSGHTIEEDQPEKLASILETFVKRNTPTNYNNRTN